MRLEYKSIITGGEWKPLKAQNLNDASKELLSMGPYGEDAKVRDAETDKRYVQSDPYGRNGGVRCDVSRGPCACGAFH